MLTSRGQVTIPKAIRDELGLKLHDKTVFTIEDGCVRLRKAYKTLEDVAGSLPALPKDFSIDSSIEMAKEERARAMLGTLTSAGSQIDVTPTPVIAHNDKEARMGRAMTLTSKGQVTIPKEVRDELGLRPHDKIEIYVENGEAKLRRARLSLKEMAGMLPPIGIPIEDMPAVAREDWVERFMVENG